MSRLSRAAREGHTCGDCWHGATDELPLARLPYLRCLRYPRYEGAVPTDAIHQPGDPACRRWKPEREEVTT